MCYVLCSKCQFECAADANANECNIYTFEYRMKQSVTGHQFKSNMIYGLRDFVDFIYIWAQNFAPNVA